VTDLSPPPISIKFSFAMATRPEPHCFREVVLPLQL
jgi:hypothetical protein